MNIHGITSLLIEHSPLIHKDRLRSHRALRKRDAVSRLPQQPYSYGLLSSALGEKAMMLTSSHHPPILWGTRVLASVLPYSKSPLPSHIFPVFRDAVSHRQFRASVCRSIRFLCMKKISRPDSLATSYESSASICSIHSKYADCISK